MDAQTLFREGVMAVREGKDPNHARQLLLQSLKLNPQNEMAWLWLSQTVSDPQKKLECVNRALKINPFNEKAIQLQAKLSPPPRRDELFDFGDEAQEESTAEAPVYSYEPPAGYREPEPYHSDLVDDKGLHAAPTIRKPLSSAEDIQVHALLRKAEDYLKTGKPEDIESAIEQWVRILEIRCDHEIAIQNAVRYLARLKYLDDAKELIWRAIDAGTLLPSIYVTAIDIAQRLRDHGAAIQVTEGLLPLNDVDDALILKITDQMVKYGQVNEVVDLLEKALLYRPKSQKIMLRLAELNDELGRKEQAVRYLDRVARVKSGTKEAKAADKALKEFTPIIDDRERGNTWLAVRESLGFVFFYLLLGWQDAGMNLAFMRGRWLGVLLSFVGGYLVISAVSSPQQQPLATWLGGKVPPPKALKRVVDAYGNPIAGVSGAMEEPTDLTMLPDMIRIFFFAVGAATLVIAFYLVFSNAIQLLLNPVTPRYLPQIEDLLLETIR